MAARHLRDAGYTVIEAADGVKAWRYCQRPPSPIDAVVADVVMPRMLTRETRGGLRPRRPQPRPVEYTRK
jgi:CheY-like chemotaxis protein